MTERNREPVTPDQNPHPPTDHDRLAPRGETPMPLVDGVALHQPPASTPPPLFRPREGWGVAGEGTPVTPPGPVLEPEPGPGPAGAGTSVAPPAPGPLLDLDPRPTGEGPGAPAPGPDSDLDLFVGLDPAPSRTGTGGTGPDRDLGPDADLDLDSRPGTAGPGAAPDAAPGATSQAYPAAAVDQGPAVDPGPAADPGPVPGPASLPDTPLKPVSLEHPGRSPHPGRGEGEDPAADRPHCRPGSGAKRTEGLGLFQPVRRPRTEPSGEWTPLPAYGGEAGPRPTPAPAAQTDRTGAETETGARAQAADNPQGASTPAPTASPSVPAPQPPPHPRRHSVIAGESTAAIPVHLLFRDDDAPRRTEPTALPTTVARQAPHPAPTHSTPADRAPRPRSPRPRVEPPTRPAPLADPRLAERPGPALSGYAALLTGAAGLLGLAALLWWRGALPVAVQSAVGLAPRPYEGVGAGGWAGLALLVTLVVLALGGLGRGRVGHAWVLTLFGDYRGTVRRTGLVWVSPLLLRRRVDVRLRHWRSEPLPAVDANGTALRVVVLVVWRIKDTVRAALGIEDHEAYLSAQVESAMARVLSQLPADAFHEDAPTLRDAEAVGDALTRMLKADCEPVGVEVYSAQPTGIEYAPEVAAAMQRRRIAAIDAKHRDSVLTSVVDAVDDTVSRLTARGIVELDDYERKALVKDLTVAFYTGRSTGGGGA